MRVKNLSTFDIRCFPDNLLGRAIHGPIPVKTETLEELSGPLVHTNFPRKRYGPMIDPYEFPPKFAWTNGAQSSPKVSVLTGIGP